MCHACNPRYKGHVWSGWTKKKKSGDILLICLKRTLSVSTQRSSASTRMTARAAGTDPKYGWPAPGPDPDPDPDPGSYPGSAHHASGMTRRQSLPEMRLNIGWPSTTRGQDSGRPHQSWTRSMAVRYMNDSAAECSSGTSRRKPTTLSKSVCKEEEEEYDDFFFCQ